MPRKGIKHLRFDDRTEYDGELCNELPNGTGKAKYPDGSEYVGSWVNGLFHGSGRLQTEPDGGILYEGEFAAGKEHGLGVLVTKTEGVKYHGEFKDGDRSGVGVEEKLNGRETYLGQFKNDRRHGFGVIKRPGMHDGQVVIEKWEAGHRVGLEGDVAREFVGGLAEAAAFVAVAALRGLASQADDIAATCAGGHASRSRARQQLMTTQHLAVPVAQLQAKKRSLTEKNLTSALEVERLKADKATERNRELSKENKKISEQLSALQKECADAQKRARMLEKALDKLSLDAEARIDAQEEHVLAVSKAQALEHEERMRRTAALYEDKLTDARHELMEARRQRETDSVGVVGGEEGKGGSVDPRKAPPRFEVVPTHGQVLTEELRSLPAPDNSCLAGPRRLGKFGEQIWFGMHAYLLHVERLSGEVDGYVGVLGEEDPDSTAGFALRYFEDSLGSGSFGASDAVGDSKSVRDGAMVILQIDADSDFLSLHSPAQQSTGKELGRVSCTLRKPWTPAAFCIHPDTLLHLLRRVEPVREESPEVLERVHPSQWQARSTQSGAHYSVPQLLRLMLRIQLSSATAEELEELLGLYHRGHRRVLDAISARLAAGQTQFAPEMSSKP